jgi:hypothetical protein
MPAILVETLRRRPWGPLRQMPIPSIVRPMRPYRRRYKLPVRTERTWELFVTINNLCDESLPLAPDGAHPTAAAFFGRIGRAFRVGIRADF